MLVRKCDVCGAVKKEMEEFIIPMYGIKYENFMEETGICYKEKEGVYSFSVDIYPVCQKKIANFIESIKTAISLD